MQKQRRTLQRGLAIALLGLGLTFGCNEEPGVATQQTPAAVASSSLGETKTKKEWGKITVSYDPAKKKKHQRVAKALKDSGAFEALADDFTSLYKLPVSLNIRFTELKEENAYWDPSTHEITVGYELVDSYSKIFEFDKKDPEAYQQEVVDAAYFTVFHELGHALVQVLDLPITGSEEDAVDEFATIALLEKDDEQSISALISGIEQFATDAAAYDEFDDSSYADDHSLDKQRFYDVLALVYGSDPETHSDLLGGDYLPEELAEDSEIEYERKVKVWARLLAPHKKNP